MEERRALLLQLTPGSYEGWSDYAADHGCTVTALAEALGRHLAAGRVDMVKVVREARAIDAERRRRPRSS